MLNHIVEDPEKRNREEGRYGIEKKKEFSAEQLDYHTRLADEYSLLGGPVCGKFVENKMESILCHNGTAMTEIGR